MFPYLEHNVIAKTAIVVENYNISVGRAIEIQTDIAIIIAVALKFTVHVVRKGTQKI